MLEQKEYDEALNYFQRAFKWYKKSANACLNIGKTLYFLKDLDQAYDYFGKAGGLDSILIEPGYYRGLVRLKQKKFQESIEIFTTALLLDSTYSQAYYQRGIARANLGDFVGSVEDYRKAKNSKEIIEYMKMYIR